jgi:hypothetical protein
MDAQPVAIVVLVRDLIFASKISSTAAAAHIPVTLLRTAALLANQSGDALIVDLNLDGAIEAAAAWIGSSQRQAIGFVAHTDAATVERARIAGITRILARSQFTAQLPQLLGELGGGGAARTNAAP